MSYIAYLDCKLLIVKSLAPTLIKKVCALFSLLQKFSVIISFFGMATGYPGKQKTSEPAAVDVS